MESAITITSIDQLKNIPGFTEFLSEELQKLLSHLKLAPKDQDTVFDLEQACKYLNLKPATIYDLKYHNKIPTLKRGRKLCFSKKALDEWNEAGRPANEDQVAIAIDEKLVSIGQKRKNRT